MRRTTRTRAGERGAAMVEATVVITTLLIFLGLIVFTRDSYVGKLNQQTRARRDAMYYAAHNCESGDGAMMGGAGFALDGDDTSDAEKVINEKGDEGATSKISRSWNLSQAHGKDTIVGTALRDRNANGTPSPIALEKAPLQREVAGDAYVFCNERPYDGNIGDWAAFAFNFFQSGIL